MKPRQTLILALVLVVLAGIAGLVETNKKKQRTPQGSSVFSAYSIDKTDAIEIKGKSQDVRLEKKDGIWTVATEGGYPADPKNSKDLVEKIAAFKTTDVVSTNKENHRVFEVDSTGVEVKAYAGGKLTADFIVGKPGPDFMSSYVRPQGKNEVYRVPVYLPSIVDRGGETWRNKLVLNLEKEKITGWTTQTPREKVTVERDAQGAWKLKEPFEAPARPDIVNIILDSLTRVRASGFGDSVESRLAEVGLEPDTTWIEVRSEGGASQKIVVGAANKANQTFTKRIGESQIYLVPKGRWTTIVRPAAFLRAEEGGEPKSEGNEAPALGIPSGK